MIYNIGNQVKLYTSTEGMAMKTEIKLLADVSAGEGHVRIMPHFDEMYSLWQIDVLQDWIADLTTEYNKRLKVWQSENRRAL
jgi:hypothetical protein